MPEDQNCPGHGGNKQATYTPSKIRNGVADVPGHYTGGFGAPKDFSGANFGTGGGATTTTVPGTL